MFGAGLYYKIFEVDKLKEISGIGLEIHPNKDMAESLAAKYKKWMKVVKQMLMKID